jgi:aspartate-semialdehyde dehydrogenase
MRKKLRAGILGATGAVGQKFIELLANHPWIEVTALAASQRSAGKKYDEVVNWFSGTPLPQAVANLEVQDCVPGLDCDFVFSGLDASVAGEIETNFAQAGYPVISNSRNHRFSPNVPLLVPDVNPEHTAIIKEQKFGTGFIVTNPNCSTTGLVIALKPLHDHWGVEQVNVVTMQALSGAGYPGVPSLDILDNVIPFIGSEESKMETETLKILGTIENKSFQNAPLKISAQCNRVAVMNGHLECVNVKLKTKASANEIITVWQNYQAEPQRLKLPSAPDPLIYYFMNEKYPQPRLHRDLGNGMAVSIGRLRECPIFDYKFIVLSHNTIRGAAGGAILNTEILIAKGLLSAK